MAQGHEVTWAVLIMSRQLGPIVMGGLVILFLEKVPGYEPPFPQWPLSPVCSELPSYQGNSPPPPPRAWEMFLTWVNECTHQLRCRWCECQSLHCRDPVLYSHLAMAWEILPFRPLWKCPVIQHHQLLWGCRVLFSQVYNFPWVFPVLYLWNVSTVWLFLMYLYN